MSSITFFFFWVEIRYRGSGIQWTLGMLQMQMQLHSEFSNLHSPFCTRHLDSRFQNSSAHMISPAQLWQFFHDFPPNSHSHCKVQPAGCNQRTCSCFSFFSGKRYCCCFCWFPVIVVNYLCISKFIWNTNSNTGIPCTAFQMLFEIPVRITIPIPRLQLLWIFVQLQLLRAAVCWFYELFFLLHLLSVGCPPATYGHLNFPRERAGFCCTK